MITRFVLHLEFHKGYRPRISFRRVPKHGERGKDGGELGIFKRCPDCSGQGVLFEPDLVQPGQKFISLNGGVLEFPIIEGLTHDDVAELGIIPNDK